MQNKNKNNNPKSMLPGLVVVLAIVIYNALGRQSLVPVIAVLIILAAGSVIVSTVAAVKKNTGAPKPEDRRLRPDHAERPVRRTAPRPARRQTTAREEAIHCRHSRGKEKYLEQLDSYLKNGIIDKAEYKVLYERYSKLDLPDDYH